MSLSRGKLGLIECRVYTNILLTPMIHFLIPGLILVNIGVHKTCLVGRLEICRAFYNIPYTIWTWLWFVSLFCVYITICNDWLLLTHIFRAASLELEQSYECFTAREVTLNDLVHTVHIVMWQTRIWGASIQMTCIHAWCVLICATMVFFLSTF